MESDNFSVKVRLSNEQPRSAVHINRENWVSLVSQQLAKLKEEDFTRVNPSVIKSSLIEAYPDFDERDIGFKKFSDMIRILEKQGSCDRVRRPTLHAGANPVARVAKKGEYRKGRKLRMALYRRGKI